MFLNLIFCLWILKTKKNRYLLFDIDKRSVRDTHFCSSFLECKECFFSDFMRVSVSACISVVFYRSFASLLSFTRALRLCTTVREKSSAFHKFYANSSLTFLLFCQVLKASTIMLTKEYRICMPLTVEEVFKKVGSNLEYEISFVFKILYTVQNWTTLHDSSPQLGTIRCRKRRGSDREQGMLRRRAWKGAIHGEKNPLVQVSTEIDFLSLFLSR